MQSFIRTSLSEFIQDRIVYRGLTPVDPSLPGLADLRSKLGLGTNVTPRKNELDYARTVHLQLQACQHQDDPFTKLSNLIFIGDTQLLDATAYANLREVSGWQGLAFIGSEDTQPPFLKPAMFNDTAKIFLSNRWSALEEFDRRSSELGLQIGPGTAVVIDMDKTMVGARGRNARVIDQMRVQAVEQTVSDLLGNSFDPEAFRSYYDPLNQPEFHPFTADNQDFLAYICLMLCGGVFSFDDLVQRVRTGEMDSFRQFINEAQERRAGFSPEFAHIHDLIFENFKAGDPTPFKSFRQNEYLLTVARFGCLKDDVPVEKMLAEEIVITQEVREMALFWREKGALLFGLSDKPDEASIPTLEYASKGFQPLHRAATHSVGE